MALYFFVRPSLATLESLHDPFVQSPSYPQRLTDTLSSFPHHCFKSSAISGPISACMEREHAYITTAHVNRGPSYAGAG